MDIIFLRENRRISYAKALPVLTKHHVNSNTVRSVCRGFSVDFTGFQALQANKKPFSEKHQY